MLSAVFDPRASGLRVGARQAVCRVSYAIEQAWSTSSGSSLMSPSSDASLASSAPIVEAPGIENDKRQTVDTIEHRNGSLGVRAVSASVSDRASKCAIDRGDMTESSGGYELSNVVETALAQALVLAAEAKRWDVVIQIADELRRRGSCQTSLVSSLRLKRSSKV